MDFTLAIALAAVFGAAVGAISVTLWRRGQATAVAGRIAELEAQLVAAREQAIRAGVQAAELEREASTLHDQLLETAQRAAVYEERARLLGDTKQAIENSFRSLSADALKGNNETFLDLARSSLVQPVRESLDKVDGKIAELERARQQAYGEIRQQFVAMAEVQMQLRTETANLVKALRQPHVRGRWGEIQLRRVVEMAGMLKHCDFVEQESAEGEEGKLRPDLLVKLPGNRQIVVDAKAPITAYMDAHEAASDELRKTKMQLHSQLVSRHLESLARKSYWDNFDPTPEFVVMFIPGEAFYSAALEADPELLDRAFGQNVIIASPATLMALLKAASYGWRQESIADNAREISQLGQELHARLSTMAEHFARMGKGLDTARDSYNAAVASFESRVLVSARKFKELGAASQEAEIIELRAVEGGVRRLQAGATPEPKSE
jgi:DNA recombination protein RmuC